MKERWAKEAKKFIICQRLRKSRVITKSTVIFLNANGVPFKTPKYSLLEQNQRKS